MAMALFGLSSNVTITRPTLSPFKSSALTFCIRHRHTDRIQGHATTVTLANLSKYLSTYRQQNPC